MSGMTPIGEASRKFNCNWWFIRRGIASGKIAAVKVRGRIYVSEDDVSRLAAPVPMSPAASASGSAA